MMERELIEELLRKLDESGYRLVIRVPFPQPAKIAVTVECCELERVEKK